MQRSDLFISWEVACWAVWTFYSTSFQHGNQWNEWMWCCCWQCFPHRKQWFGFIWLCFSPSKCFTLRSLISDAPVALVLSSICPLLTTSQHPPGLDWDIHNHPVNQSTTRFTFRGAVVILENRRIKTPVGFSSRRHIRHGELSIWETDDAIISVRPWHTPGSTCSPESCQWVGGPCEPARQWGKWIPPTLAYGPCWRKPTLIHVSAPHPHTCLFSPWTTSGPRRQARPPTCGLTESTHWKRETQTCKHLADVLTVTVSACVSVCVCVSLCVRTFMSSFISDNKQQAKAFSLTSNIQYSLVLCLLSPLCR